MTKRCIDLLGAITGLLILSPLIMVVAMISRMKLGSPIVFTQLRAGYQCKPIRIYKFRTMTNEKDQHGNLLPDEKRLTRYGAFLRRWSLDELPQLINVVKGDLSIVGPRPLLMEYLPLYTSEQVRRHDVKPGITGWAQINGRNDISWEKKFALDVWYVDHQSLLLDAKIICLTCITIVKGKGIHQEGHATAPKFIRKSNETSKQKTELTN